MTNNKWQVVKEPAKALSTRKDVAGVLGVSVDAVRRNEKRWGIDKARVDLNARCVRYRHSMLMFILAARGFFQAPVGGGLSPVTD